MCKVPCIQYYGSSLNPFPIKKMWNRDACWLKHYSTFHCCCHMPLTAQTTEFIFIQEVILHDSVQKPRLIREVLFADDAAVASPTDEALQRLFICFASVFKKCSLIISIKKQLLRAKMQLHTQHFYYTPYPGSVRRVQLPGFHHRTQPIPRYRAEQVYL